MANFSLYLFLGIALVIVTVAVLYVSNRFASSLGAVRYWPFRVVFLCLMVYTAVGTLTYFSTIGIALAVSIYGTLHSNTIHVKTSDIPVKGLTKDMKAVHLTDIHIGHFRNNPEYLQEIIAKTNAQQPDVIF